MHFARDIPGEGYGMDIEHYYRIVSTFRTRSRALRRRRNRRG